MRIAKTEKIILFFNLFMIIVVGTFLIVFNIKTKREPSEREKEIIEEIMKGFEYKDLDVGIDSLDLDLDLGYLNLSK